jgi:hypothetical protein
MASVIRRPRGRATTFLAVLLVLIGCFFRLVYLGADPDYDDWAGYVTDEGRWVQAARGLVLHDELPRGGVGELHLVLAPIFQALSFLVFWIFDVTIASSRLLPALSACATLVVFWLMMRPVAGEAATLVGLAVLAFQADFLALSRLAIPEAPVTLLALLIYRTLTARPSTRGGFRAGLLTAVALGVKATSAPLALVGLTVAATVAPVASRMRSVLAYLGGILTPAAVGAVCALALLSTGVLAAPSYPFQVMRDFLGVSSVYDILSFAFMDDFGKTYNFMAFGLWVSLVATANPDPIRRDPVLSRHLVSSAAWIGLFTPIMLGLSYFPTRYRVIVLVPLAIHLSCALGLIARMQASSIVDAFAAGWRGWRGVLNRAVLVVPTAVLIATLAASAVIGAGQEPDRLTTKLVSIAGATVGLAIALELGRPRRALITWFLLSTPLLLLTSGVLAWVGVPFWSLKLSALRLGLGTAVLLLAAALARRAPWRSPPHRPWTGVFVSASLLIAAAGVADASSRYLFPSYSIRQTAGRLVPLLAECRAVRVLRAEGILNGNDISYGGRERGETDCLVTTFLTTADRGQIRRDYLNVATFPLFVSRRYCEKLARDEMASGVRPGGACPVEVEVYRRRP